MKCGEGEAWNKGLVWVGVKGREGACTGVGESECITDNTKG